MEAFPKFEDCNVAIKFSETDDVFTLHHWLLATHSTLPFFTEAYMKAATRQDGKGESTFTPSTARLMSSVSTKARA